jgi:V/A-type H+/Na+-transporting ATPase subunit E
MSRTSTEGRDTMTIEDKGALKGLASSGVEALIERLRDEGVQVGRAEAQRIEAEARREAARIVRDAESRAKAVREAAQQEVDALRKGGEEALRIAMRDTVLRLKADLSDRFSDEVKRLIAAKIEQEAFLEQLILEVASKARAEAGIDAGEAVEIQLPKALIGPEELRRNPLELREGSLSHFVLSLAGNILAEGVTFGVAAGADGKGIRLALKGKDVHIDLTDETVAATLLAHLQPRFRAILEGMVK